MNLSEAKRIMERNGYHIDSWKDDENFKRYLREKHIVAFLTPDDLLEKHYEVFKKLNHIEEDFKR